MEISLDQNLALVALRAAYGGQSEIGLFYHLKVAETLVALAARFAVSLHLDRDGFVDWAGEVYGQMAVEGEVDAARGQNPREGMPGIPASGDKDGLLVTMKADPDIWARVSNALGPTTSVKIAETRAATLLATAAKSWYLSTLDRDSFLYAARHFHEEVAQQASKLR